MHFPLPEGKHQTFLKQNHFHSTGIKKKPTGSSYCKESKVSTMSSVELCPCVQTHRASDTKVAFIKSERAATYSSLIPKISPELQTFSHKDWLHMPHSFRLTPKVPPINSETARWIDLCARGRRMQTCLPGVKIFHSRGQLMALAFNIRIGVMMYGAPVCGKLFHVSHLTAPVGKLANGEVHGEAVFWAAECRWESLLLSCRHHKRGEKNNIILWGLMSSLFEDDNHEPFRPFCFLYL